MSKIFKFIIAILIIFVLLILWGILQFFIENKEISVDESVLDVIAETDWSDTDLLEAKELDFSGRIEDRWSFFGSYDSDDVSYFIYVSPASHEDNQELRSYKNLKYYAFEHKELSFKNIFSSNDDVERYLTVYVDGMKVLVTEYNKSSNDIAFYDFFRENNVPLKRESPKSFYGETEKDYSAFIKKNGSDRNVGSVNNEDTAAKKAVELWLSELGAEVENFIGGPEICVYYSASDEYWIVEGTYPKDILTEKYKSITELSLPTTIIAFDGKVIANGWK